MTLNASGSSMARGRQRSCTTPRRCGAMILALAMLGLLNGCESTPRESSTIPPMHRSGEPDRLVSATDPARATPVDVRTADQQKEVGRSLLEQSRWQAARDAYRLALEANPNDSEAVAGYNRALAMMDEGSSIDRVQRAFALRREQTLTMFDAAVEGAYDAIGRDDLGLAERRLLEARARLVRNEDVLRTDEYEPRLEAVDDALRRLDRARELRRLTAQETSTTGN